MTVLKTERGNKVGMFINRFWVLKKLKQDGRDRAFYRCRCLCGAIVEVAGTELYPKGTKSCGCLKKETSGNLNRSHGMSKTRLYSIWCNMKSRCSIGYGKNSVDYKERGIVVCDEWKHDFESFYTWAINAGYREDLSIERIDVNGNYEPSNCCWIPLYAQAWNKRNSTRITFNGETLDLVRCVMKYGKVSYANVRNRLNLGWSIERALIEPLNRREK